MTVAILVTHEVKDFNTWKKGFVAGKGAREKAGLKELVCARDTKNANVVHVVFQGPSVEAVTAFMSSPELQDTMMKAGVIGKPDIRLGNVA